MACDLNSLSLPPLTNYSHPSGKQSFLLIALRDLKVGCPTLLALSPRSSVFETHMVAETEQEAVEISVCIQCPGNSETNYLRKATAGQRLEPATTLSGPWSAIHKVCAVSC